MAVTQRAHANFMIGALAPDLRRSGYVETAKDVARCGKLMRAQKTNGSYASWLKSTLVPDLRSMLPETAKDLARCARAITPYSRRRR